MFIHYLAVMSAIYYIQPDKVFVYYDSEQEENIYWDIIKKYVELEQITPPTEFKGHVITAPQYKADIIRLEKLIERGGIYLDLDILVMKSFDEFLDNKCALTARPSEALENSEKLAETQNSILLTEPHNPFIQKWYDTMGDYISSDFEWSYHAVCLPAKILRENRDLLSGVKLLDCDKYFLPFLWDVDTPYIFDSQQNNKREELNNYYTIMFFQTMVFDKYLRDLKPGYFRNNNNLFTEHFKQFGDEVIRNKDGLLRYIWENYHNKNWDRIIELCDLYQNICDVDINEDKDLQYTHFFLAMAYFNKKKITKSTEIYSMLINLKNLDPNLKEWIPNNLNLSKTYYDKRRAQVYQEAWNAYTSQNWTLLNNLCEEYKSLMVETNYDLQHILFFSAYANKRMDKAEKSKEIYDNLLQTNDIHPSVEVWARHNRNVV